MFYNLHCRLKLSHLSTWLSWMLYLQRTLLHHFIHTFTKSNVYSMYLVKFYNGNLSRILLSCFIVRPQCSDYVLFSHSQYNCCSNSEHLNLLYSSHMSTIHHFKIYFHFSSRFSNFPFNHSCTNIFNSIALIPWS